MPRYAKLDPTIGERIKVRRLMRGWSVRHAASRAGLSHATWSRIERGLQAADNRFVLTDIAAALECSPIELTGTLVPAGDRQVQAAQAHVYGIRQALIETDLAEPSTMPTRPVAELQREVALLRELRHDCDYAGASRVLPALIREVHAVAAAPAGEEGLRLFCNVMYLASSILRTLNYPAEAWLAAERCRSAAERLDDQVLLGCAAYQRANAATGCGSFRRGLSLAERAIQDLDSHLALRGGLEVYGMLQLFCGHATRALKQPADSATWTSEATQIALRTGETTTLGLYFGPTNIAIWRISAETDGGDPGYAIEIAKTTNPSVIGVNIRTVFFYADLARAYADVGGLDQQAVRSLLTAERIAPQHVRTSPLARETARGLLERSSRRNRSADLRGLCERLGLG